MYNLKKYPDFLQKRIDWYINVKQKELNIAKSPFFLRVLPSLDLTLPQMEHIVKSCKEVLPLVTG
jgi:hypothetical protein